MGKQLTRANPAARLKTTGRWEDDSDCHGNGVTAARPPAPSARSPSLRPAGIAALEAKINTLQAEIAELERIVAGQRVDLERERHRANALGDELLKVILALPRSCRPMGALKDDRGGGRGQRASF
jgi:hypothetical protein